MAYAVFWKYNYIYITIVDSITTCIEVCKVIRCQYLRHLSTQSQLHSYLTPAFGLSIELSVCVIEVRCFYESSLYRQNSFCKDTEIVLSKDSLLRNNNDARRIRFPKHPDRIWSPHGTRSNDTGDLYREQSDRGVKLPTHPHPVPRLGMARFTISLRSNNFTLFL